MTATTVQGVVEVNDLRAYYRSNVDGGERIVYAVDGVSFAVRSNEVFGIAGESGCGKSTLLKALLGWLEPPLHVAGGSVIYHLPNSSIDIVSIPEHVRRRLRWKSVSYIPQGSMHVLNPIRRVRDTFRDVIRAHRQCSNAEAETLARDYIRNLGLPTRTLDVYPHQLSGGMRQRVVIALATILSPAIVLADEPTTALDVVAQRGVLDFLNAVRHQQRSSLVLVTHDMGVHAHVASRIAILYAGQLLEEADTWTVLAEPRHPYTMHLIRSLPRLGDRSQRHAIPGQPPLLASPPPGCRFHPRCPYAKQICSSAPPPLVEIAPGHRVACYWATGVGGTVHGAA